MRWGCLFFESSVESQCDGDDREIKHPPPQSVPLSRPRGQPTGTVEIKALSAPGRAGGRAAPTSLTASMQRATCLLELTILPVGGRGRGSLSYGPGHAGWGGGRKGFRVSQARSIFPWEPPHAPGAETGGGDPKRRPFLCYHFPEPGLESGSGDSPGPLLPLLAAGQPLKDFGDGQSPTVSGPLTNILGGTCHLVTRQRVKGWRTPTQGGNRVKSNGASGWGGWGTERTGPGPGASTPPGCRGPCRRRHWTWRCCSRAGASPGRLRSGCCW